MHDYFWLWKVEFVLVSFQNVFVLTFLCFLGTGSVGKNEGESFWIVVKRCSVFRKVVKVEDAFIVFEIVID